MAKAELKRAYEEMRQQVAAEQSPFGKTTAAERKKRREAALKNPKLFAETYLPHHCKKPFSKMHLEMFEKYKGFLEKSEVHNEGSKDAIAAPRGNAKSTITTLSLPLYSIFSAKRKFIVIISDTTDQANEFLEMIKAEIEVNERLKEDFPKLFGPGAKWKVGQIITKNGVMIKTYGSAKGIRGAKHGSMRPDLVICDDLESDDSIDSPDQRTKMQKWFFKAVTKLGAEYTIYIVVGTVLHYDSLLAKLLKQPGWTRKKYKAMIKKSHSPLWKVWEEIFSDLEDPRAQERAKKFFEENKEEMLEGTEVLWPEGEPYYYLMCMWVEDGPAYFDSEKQNEPINPDDCAFQEPWFVFWDDQYDYSRQRYQEIYCWVDPSMGKSKKSDPSAIVIGGVQENGLIDILEADIVRRHPDAIMERIFDYHEQYDLTIIGIESVQFQELFADDVIKEGAKRRIYPPVEGFPQHHDKTLRIMKLQPHIKNGVIRFRRNQTILIEQLKYFPKAANDDGPDALEGVFKLSKEGTHGPQLRSVA